MSIAVRRAASVAAVLACAVPVATAHAQGRGDRLVAQLAQATPGPTPSDQPPLTPRPPQPLGTATPTATATPATTATATATPEASASPAATPTAAAGGALARTGSDARLVALAGLSLLGIGAGLRWAVQDGAAV